MANSTVKEIQKLLTKLSEDKSESVELTVAQPELPFKIGQAYLIRTVTLYYTAKVSDIVGKFLILDECAWIPDTGRFMQAIEKGTFGEVEPMGNSIILNTDSVIDATPIDFKLPKEQK